MEKQDQESYASGQTEQSEGNPYLVRLENVPAEITLKGAPMNISLHGEILLESPSQPGEDSFVVSGLRYLTMWSEPLDDLNGLLTIAGPVGPVKMPLKPYGEIDQLDFRLYYSPLGELEPAYVESDAVYPPIEVIRGRLAWKSVQLGEQATPGLDLLLTLDKPVVTHLGLVETLNLGPLTLPVQPLISQPQDTPKHYSLQSCTDMPPMPGAGCTAATHSQRALRLQFICPDPLPAGETLETLEDLAQFQIEGACKVWWRKGGIKIEVDDNSAHIVPDANLGAAISEGPQASNLPNVVTNKKLDTVEVYLVQHIESSQSGRRGGLTYGCGTQDAYIILEIGEARNDHYLLAHEIGHVFGIGHPASASDSVPGLPHGSDCSVMMPDRPNSPRNTQVNLDLTIAGLPLGPVLTQIINTEGTPLSCAWCPDLPQSFSHIIRDFPYDDGSEVSSLPSSLLPITSWWTHSDVWNSPRPPFPGQNRDEEYNNHTPMFRTNHSPIHAQPLRMETNHMCVRVHTCQNLLASVDVYLYLALPGATTVPLHPLNGNAPLVFSHTGNLRLSAGVPFTKSVAWTVPHGFPAHCSVFALAKTTGLADPQLDPIINNPAAPHFTNLSVLVKSDNDVAQRSLNIRNIAPLGATLTQFSLPWISIANPTNTSGQAFLDIDTSQTPSLVGLQYEILGQSGIQVNVGGVTRVSLFNILQPGETHILRLKAALRTNLPEGTEIPIDLQFSIDNNFVAGYQHLLRVAPLVQVLHQTLDTLYGALVDVHVGCGITSALGLSEQVAEIAILHANDPNSALSALLGITPQFSHLGLELQQSQQPACQQLGSSFLGLAGLLSAQQITSHSRVEQLYDLSDRIQEPAGRLARQAG